MSVMADPSKALHSLQKALNAREIELLQCPTDSALYVYRDYPNGKLRFSYIRLDKSVVTALVLLVLVDLVDELPCFQLGYAVLKSRRNKGIATSTVFSAINEFKTGMARTGLNTFFIEAIVDADNVASRRVSERAISPHPKEITDRYTGCPAYKFVCKITT